MRDDPFARLSGLDQQLFVPRSSAPAVPTTVPSDSTPAKSRTAQRPGSPSAGQTAEPPTAGRPERPTGGPVQRTIDRRSYSFFHDQVRSLNRIKLEIQERYDAEVSANAMVQLAVDLLILDHRRRGRHSQLMRNLVFGEPPEGETAERPDVDTAERPEGGE